MSTTPDLCEQCNASGLPILPVRYAVIPNNPRFNLPAWATGERVKEVPLGSDYKYALRTLREGYLYLFYSRNHYGPNQWECYVVGEDGSLRQQRDTTMTFRQSSPVFQCARRGHNALGMHYLVIDRPETCGQTWLAFSETKWSPETLAEYTRNAKLRNARMQSLHPAQMAAGTAPAHGTPATPVALAEVVEYQHDALVQLARPEGVAQPISEENGRYTPNLLTQVSTRYPLHRRQGEAASTVEHMQRRGKTAKGQATPHLIALWDAVGITHELNGFRNDAAGWLDKYADERALQISALNAIDGTRQALAKQGKARMQQHHKRVMSRSQFDTAMRVKPNPYGWPESARWVPFKSAEEILNHGPGLGYVILPEGYIDQSIARDWEKYEARLDPTALKTFRENWAKFLEAADRLIDQRTDALVNWLEAPLFIDTLEDFHTKNLEDGVMFEDAVGEAIFGIGSSEKGRQKLDAWVKEAKASVKNNLLWRAIALNQAEGIAEVDAALALAYGAQVGLTTQAWEQVVNQIKWNKILDLAKKSLGAFNTQMKAVNDPSSGIRPVQSMRGLEKIFASVGGQWLSPFKWTADTVNEAMLRTLLLVRSGADPVAAKALGAWDAIHSSADREMLLRRLKNQDVYLSEAAKAQYDEHAKKWAGLRANVEVPDAKRKSFNAARDARLALIVAVFEAFNLHKASVKAGSEPDNEKVQTQLAAAQLATAAAAIDVVSNMLKGLAAAGDRATSYQMLKLGGGGLAVAASGYGAYLDVVEFRKNLGAANYRMAILAIIRGSFQGVGSVLSALTALSYCSPLIETFGKRFGERLVGKVLTSVAARLLLARAALLFASLEVSIFLLFVSGVIWVFTDDGLEAWCDRCAFGIKRKALSDAYASAVTQQKRFDEALQEVL